MAGARHAPVDRLGGVLSARFQALAKLLERGRQDEDAHHVREELAQLLRALPIDLQEHVMVAGELGLDPLARGAVVVAVDVRVLEEFVRGDHFLEFRARDEEVIDAVLLARARRARGPRRRQVDVRLALQQSIHERGLAGAGRGDNHEEVAARPTQCFAPARASAR